MCFLCSALGLQYSAIDNAENLGGDHADGARPSLTTSQAVLHIAEGAWANAAQPITYAFRSTGSTTFTRFNATEIRAAELALQEWADVANIHFQRVGSGTTGEAAYSNSATILFNNLTSSSSFAYAYYPGRAEASSLNGDVFLNTGNYPSLLRMDLGSYSLMTMIHEIGHAIGLSHPGDYNALTGASITYATNAEYVEDTRQYTVMSYFDATYTGAQHAGTYASTPLLHDIAALQALYGANTTTRTGDTVYGFHSNADRESFALTSPTQKAVFSIWDAGGTDTLDFSGYSSSQWIDLHAGAFSNVGGLQKNVSIAEGVTIENAVGGSGDDVILGNAAANEITGGAGNDVIVSEDGNDVIHGDAGNDRVNAGTGDDTVFGGDGDDELGGGLGNDVLVGDDGQDVLFGEDGNDAANGGAGDDIVVGGAGTDVLGGGMGDDILVGNEGNDTIFGEGGNDRANGGDGADLILGGADDDQLGGGSGDDNIQGGDGNDTLWGEDGDDLLTGGAGNDVLLGMAGNDTFVFAPGSGTDTILDFSAGPGSEDHIMLVGTNLHSFADVLSHARFDPASGVTTIAHDAGDQIRLAFVSVANLHQDDFMFA